MRRMDTFIIIHGENNADMELVDTFAEAVDFAISNRVNAFRAAKIYSKAIKGLAATVYYDGGIDFTPAWGTYDRLGVVA